MFRVTFTLRRSATARSPFLSAVSARQLSLLADRRVFVGNEATILKEVFGGKKVVVFGIPAPFTPTCTEKSFPSYVKNEKEFESRGINVICLAVSDRFVMEAWKKSMKFENSGIELLSDFDGSVTRMLNMEVDMSAAGLGKRCKRFSVFVNNGEVMNLVAEEKPGEMKVTGGDQMLEYVKNVVHN